MFDKTSYRSQWFVSLCFGLVAFSQDILISCHNLLAILVRGSCVCCRFISFIFTDCRSVDVRPLTPGLGPSQYCIQPSLLQYFRDLTNNVSIDDSDPISGNDSGNSENTGNEMGSTSHQSSSSGGANEGSTNRTQQNNNNSNAESSRMNLPSAKMNVIYLVFCLKES